MTAPVSGWMRTSMPGPPGVKLSSRLVKETKAEPPGPEASTDGAARVGLPAFQGRSALPDGRGMLARGGGARLLPPLQAARTVARTRGRKRMEVEGFMSTSC